MSVSFKSHGIAAIFCWSILVVSGQYKDWFDPAPVSSPAPVSIMEQVGSVVRLQCCGKGRKNVAGQEGCGPHEVVWHYKRCGFGYNFKRCESSSDEESWTTICGNSIKPCQATLVLNMTTEGDNGLYRCSMTHRNKTSKDFRVIKTYQLEIIEILGPPEFLQEHPSNVSVQESKPAVFQCRVHSKERPIFYWLRRTDDKTSNNIQIPLLNDTYKLMNSSGVRDLPGEVYLSKLILPRSSEQDNGYYTCVAINSVGFKYRGAYLTVEKDTQVDSPTSDNAPSSSLPLLFLIPAALILVPVTVWACCQWKKCCRKNQLPTHSQHNPIITSDSGHHNNNPALNYQKSNGRDFKYKPVSLTGHCSSTECQRKCSHNLYV